MALLFQILMNVRMPVVLVKTVDVLTRPEVTGVSVKMDLTWASTDERVRVIFDKSVY